MSAGVRFLLVASVVGLAVGFGSLGFMIIDRHAELQRICPVGWPGCDLVNATEFAGRLMELLVLFPLFSVGFARIAGIVTMASMQLIAVKVPGRVFQ